MGSVTSRIRPATVTVFHCTRRIVTLIYIGPYSEHRPSVHDSLLRRDAAPTKKYDVDVTVPVKLIYLRTPISTESRVASCAVVSDGTEVGCVRSGATKSAGTLSIEIWLAPPCTATWLCFCDADRKAMETPPTLRVVRCLCIRCRNTKQYYDRTELILGARHTHGLYWHQLFPLFHTRTSAPLMSTSQCRSPINCHQCSNVELSNYCIFRIKTQKEKGTSKLYTLLSPPSQ